MVKDPVIAGLRHMHHVVKTVCHLNECGPGTEAFSLLSSLGSTMGQYPRVNQWALKEAKRRYRMLMIEISGECSCGECEVPNP